MDSRAIADLAATVLIVKRSLTVNQALHHCGMIIKFAEAETIDK